MFGGVIYSMFLPFYNILPILVFILLVPGGSTSKQGVYIEVLGVRVHDISSDGDSTYPIQCDRGSALAPHPRRECITNGVQATFRQH